MLIELILPGGTLIAVLLYVHQRLRASGGLGAAHPARPPAVAVARLLCDAGPAAAGALDRVRAWVPACRGGAC